MCILRTPRIVRHHSDVEECKLGVSVTVALLLRYRTRGSPTNVDTQLCHRTDLVDPEIFAAATCVRYITPACASMILRRAAPPWAPALGVIRAFTVYCCNLFRCHSTHCFVRRHPTLDL